LGKKIVQKMREHPIPKGGRGVLGLIFDTTG
jgi:hypothetical protein